MFSSYLQHLLLRCISALAQSWKYQEMIWFQPSTYPDLNSTYTHMLALMFNSSFNPTNPFISAKKKRFEDMHGYLFPFSIFVLFKVHETYWYFLVIIMVLFSWAILKHYFKCNFSMWYKQIAYFWYNTQYSAFIPFAQDMKSVLKGGKILILTWEINFHLHLYLYPCYLCQKNNSSAYQILLQPNFLEYQTTYVSKKRF